MVWRKTVLIQKGQSKGTIPSKYRPITSLPNIWKILTEIIPDKTHEPLGVREVLLEGKKRFKKGAQGTNDLIFINKMVLKEAKRRKKI